MNETRTYWPLLKLARAGHHLKAVKKEIQGCLGSDSKTVVTDCQTEPGYMILKAFLKNQPSPMCSLRVGEILYQLRSALDHLICVLTEKNGKVVNIYREFPIFCERDKFRDPFTGKLKERILQRIDGLTLEQQAMVEGEQPFQGKHGVTENDPLAILYTLSNFDRHRFLHLVTVIAGYTFTEFIPANAGSFLEKVDATSGPLKDDTEVARFRILNYSGPESCVQVNSHVAFEIAFDQSSGIGVDRPVLETLSDIGARVGGVMAPFARFLE